MSRIQRATQILGALAEPVTALPTKYNEWLGTLPSTNFRIQWSVVAIMGTAVRYWSSETIWTLWQFTFELKKWEPSYEWLAFLLLLAGVDSMQFKWKRETHKPEGPGAMPPAPGASL